MTKLITDIQGIDLSRIEDGFLILKYENDDITTQVIGRQKYLVRVDKYVVVCLGKYAFDKVDKNTHKSFESIIEKLQERIGKKGDLTEFVLYPRDEKQKRSQDDYESFVDGLFTLETKSISQIKDSDRKKMYKLVKDFFLTIEPDQFTNLTHKQKPKRQSRYPLNESDKPGKTPRFFDLPTQQQSNHSNTKKAKVSESNNYLSTENLVSRRGHGLENSDLLWSDLEDWFGPSTQEKNGKNDNYEMEADSQSNDISENNGLEKVNNYPNIQRLNLLNDPMEIDIPPSQTQFILQNPEIALKLKNENQQKLDEILKCLEAEDFFKNNPTDDDLYPEPPLSHRDIFDLSKRKKNPNEVDGVEKYKDFEQRNLNELHKKVFLITQKFFEDNKQATDKEIDVLFILNEIWPKIGNHLQEFLHKEKLNTSTVRKRIHEYEYDNSENEDSNYKTNKPSDIHKKILGLCVERIVAAATKWGCPIVSFQSSTMNNKYKLSAKYQDIHKKLPNVNKKWENTHSLGGALTIKNKHKKESMNKEESFGFWKNRVEYNSKNAELYRERIQELDSKGYFSSDLDNDPTLQKALMDAFMTALDKMFDQMDKDKSEWVITLDLNDEKLAKLNKEEIRKFLNTKTHDYQFSLPCEKPSSNTAIVTVSAEYIKQRLVGYYKQAKKEQVVLSLFMQGLKEFFEMPPVQRDEQTVWKISMTSEQLKEISPGKIMALLKQETQCNFTCVINGNTVTLLLENNRKTDEFSHESELSQCVNNKDLLERYYISQQPFSELSLKNIEFDVEEIIPKSTSYLNDSLFSDSDSEDELTNNKNRKADNNPVGGSAILRPG